MSPKMLFSGTENETPFRACTPAKDFLISTILTIAFWAIFELILKKRGGVKS
jgi:hypothetical protein